MVKKSPSNPRDSQSNSGTTKDTSLDSGTVGDLSSDSRWLLAQRVAQSEPFRHSPRLRGFLLFIVERTIRNGAAELGEYEIGTQAFDRTADFDPASDSIVRSSARLLRAKLKEYFDGDGRKEPLLIEVPKGGYVPAFVARPAADGAAPGKTVPPHANGFPKVTYALSAACLVLLIACAILWRARGSRTAPKPDVALPPSVIFSIFPPGAGLNLVYGDSTKVLAADLRPPNLTLDEYIRREERANVSESSRSVGPEGPGNRLVTGYRDAAFGLRLAEAACRRGRTIIAHHSRLMQARDFRSGNFILLGGILSNAWSNLFESQLNFRFEADPSGSRRYGFRNVSPHSGEAPFYWFSSEEGRSAIRYARIAVTPNLTGTGKVLMLSGQSAEGTEGVGDAVLARDFFGQVQRLVGNRALHEVTSLELLLEVHSIDGAASDTKILAYRVR